MFRLLARSRVPTVEARGGLSKRRWFSTNAKDGTGDTATELRESFDYCTQVVRRHDYEGYLCTAGLPQHLRPAALAIRAFNVETVQAIESTKEAPLATMRLQFWKDAVKDVYQGKPPAHPVARAIAKLVDIAHPPKRWFDRIVTTRGDDLKRNGPHASLAAVEAYAEGTQSAMLYLILQSIGVTSTHADHAATHVGKAVGLATLLRGTTHLATRRQCYLPADLMLQYGVSQESVYRGEASDALADVVFKCASMAKAHLDHGRELSGGPLPPEATPVLLPSLQADLYLKALEAANFNVFDPTLLPGSRADAWRQLQLQGQVGWHAWKKTY